VLDFELVHGEKTLPVKARMGMTRVRLGINWSHFLAVLGIKLIASSTNRRAMRSGPVRILWDYSTGGFADDCESETICPTGKLGQDRATSNL